jgi:hypothetical protein
MYVELVMLGRLKYSQAAVSVGVQMVVEKLKRCRWPGTNQIPAEDKEYILRYININSCI